MSQEIQRMNNLLQSKMQECEDWKNKYNQIYSQYSGCDVTSSLDLPPAP